MTKDQISEFGVTFFSLIKDEKPEFVARKMGISKDSVRAILKKFTPVLVLRYYRHVRYKGKG